MDEQQRVIIKYKQIISAISSELLNTWNGLINSGDAHVVEEIKNIKSIEISDEQFFRKQEESRKLRRGTVYLVVRFRAGAINFSASASPISIYALGIANQVEPVQILLSTFASTWTIKNLCQGLVDEHGVNLEMEDVLQVWNTPEVVSNFNAVDEDFRNLYSVTGNLIVGPDVVRVGTLTYFYTDENGEEQFETVNVLNFQSNYRTSMDSQPFGNTNGFSKSEANFSAYSFSVSTYLLDNQLSADVLALAGYRNRLKPGGFKSKKSNNDIFKIGIVFTNGFTNMPADGELPDADDPVMGEDNEFYMEYKVVDVGIGQPIAQIPTLTIAFTR